MARAMIASAIAEEFARSSKAQMKRRMSPRAIGMRDPSLRWPHLYDILRSKGYSKEKSARIANSRLKYRKKGRLEGLPYKQADNPSALAKVRKEQESKRKGSRTASALVAACHSRACAPPPTGSGGSNQGGSGNGKGLGSLSQSELNDRLDMYRDFPEMRSGSGAAEYNSLVAEQRRRVARNSGDKAASSGALEGLKDPDGGFTIRVPQMTEFSSGFAVALKGTDKLKMASEAFGPDGKPTQEMVDMVVDRIDAAMAAASSFPSGVSPALGGWHNPDDGKVEVNVTAVFPAHLKARAISFAKEQDQIAIFDLEKFEVIPTGGTGGNRETN